MLASMNAKFIEMTQFIIFHYCFGGNLMVFRCVASEADGNKIILSEEEKILLCRTMVEYR